MNTAQSIDLVEFQDQGKPFETYIAHRAKPGEKKPTLLVFHPWSGRDEFVCKKAEQLAELGYVGVAMDLFGKGVIGKTREEKSNLIMPLLENRKALRDRMLIGLNVIQKQPYVDTHKMAAIGYCFGGLCVIDLARSGAPIRGVVSFHGLLNAPTGLKNERIQAKILALHGHDDPMVKPDQVLAFETEMTQAKADWQVHVYGNTMHAFTHPEANDPDFGTVYNPAADRRSWQAMKNFLEETLAAL